jgi:tetratricopeptide (TPR) repeat protein
VRRLLAELVRREVLAVRADPLSPQRGHYGFVQTMFRQVAYDTSSRRERKVRHLAVADHLQSTFADGGEEVAEVIAAHLLDALSAVPDDPDVAVIRDRAVEMLAKAGDRAERTGAPAAAAINYAMAADLLHQEGTVTRELAAAGLLERAGQAGSRQGDWSTAAGSYRGAANIYRRYDRVRDAARAESKVAGVMRRQGRFEEARTGLEGALAVLESEPNADTAEALHALANLHVFAGNASEADRLTAAALTLAQALDLSDGMLAGMFVSRGIAHAVANRPAQAAANLYEAVRRAEKAEDSEIVGAALANLTEVVLVSDPTAAVDPGREAVNHCRRLGNRYQLGAAAGNLVQALTLAGDWERAEDVYAKGADADRLNGDIVFDYPGLLLSVFLGEDVQTAAMLGRLQGESASEEPQEAAFLELALAIGSSYQGRQRDALAHATRALSYGETYGPSHGSIRWGWPIAAEAALTLGYHAEVNRLLEWLDGHQPGHVPPLLRAERIRIWARKLAADNEAEAASAFDSALSAFRDFGSPYHVAVGLVDYAEYLHETGETERAHELAAEAEAITARLGARPLSERARRISPSTAERVQERSTELGVEA